MNLKERLNNDRNNFIEDNKNFIYTTTYNVCKRRLQWENDDELSIAMIAFNNACNSYEENRGNFFSYARVLIKNSLINYFKKISNKTYLMFSDDDDATQYIELKKSMDNYETQVENEKRAEEIKLFSQELLKYKITIKDLIKSSPSHKDTKNSLLNIAIKCSANEDIISYIKAKKMLPIKQICMATEAKVKFIEKWRRYLICIILIMNSDDYIYLRSYLNIEVGDESGK
ncbi:sigma factor [Clostridium lundense]|uniref:sigma factor n=1 Tax=Clostridium lundense TaxID=319475 RepID=UPI0004835D81|nr:sigma factor [Clostridium lundense]